MARGMMDVRSRLKRDHEILRSKLNVLESALRVWPESWFVACEISFTITRLLGAHLERESQPEVAQLLGADDFPKADHHGALRQLQAINGLFADGANGSSSQLPSVLRRVIAALRRQCCRQDQRLSRFLKEQPSGFDTGGAPPWINSLTEEMTVNQVMRIHPGTRSVFEALFISSAFEGYECLDEVAWKHGMEASELIARLRAVIGFGLDDEPDALVMPRASHAQPLLGDRNDAIHGV